MVRVRYNFADRGGWRRFAALLGVTLIMTGCQTVHRTEAGAGAPNKAGYAQTFVNMQLTLFDHGHGTVHLKRRNVGGQLELCGYAVYDGIHPNQARRALQAASIFLGDEKVGDTSFMPVFKTIKTATANCIFSPQAYRDALLVARIKLTQDDILGFLPTAKTCRDCLIPLIDF